MPSIENALRKLVREELDKLGAKPARRHVEPLWLGLVVANVAMLLWLVSDRFFELLDDPRSEMLLKLLGVVGGSALVATYAGWRDRFVKAMDERWFKVVAVAMFPLLLTLHLNIVPVTAQVNPRLAELWVDGARVASPGGTAKLALKLRRHAIQLRPDQTLPDLGSVDFHFGWGEIFRAMWRREDFRWSLLWPVSISSIEPMEALQITRIDGEEFGPEFTQIVKGYSFQVTSPTVLALNTGVSTEDTLALRLPAGKYIFTARHADPCPGEDEEITVSARAPRFEHEFKHTHEKGAIHQ